MEKELAGKLENFRKVVTTTGEDIVFRKFPNKILYDKLLFSHCPVGTFYETFSELHQFIQSTLITDSPFHISHSETSTDCTVYPPPSSILSDAPQAKKRKRDNGIVDFDDTTHPISRNDPPLWRFSSHILANKHMSQDVHSIIKKECEQLAEMLDQVKLWVTLTMPKIEDGDNFGVQIQEEVLSELHRAQESAYNLRDAARQDYLARAKICSKIAKYPNVEDYSLALKEHDEKQLYFARQHLLDLRNMYAVLTDLIHKNISKIRVPKANNSVGLY